MQDDENEVEEDLGQASPEEQTDELALAKEQSAQYKNNWLRTQADFENYKKRKENENKELIDFAREVVVAKLLPNLDTIQQALVHTPEDPSKLPEWKNGISGTLKQLEDTLQELGVRKIDSLGKKFDPNFHEAVKEVPGEEDGIVVEEYQVGYELNGKVIRPSQVVISRKE